MWRRPRRLPLSVITMLVTERVFTAVLLLFTAMAATTAAFTGWQHGSSLFGHQNDYNHVCYRTVPNPYVYFGTKTTYGAVAGNDLQTPQGMHRDLYIIQIGLLPTVTVYSRLNIIYLRPTYQWLPLLVSFIT